MSSSKYWVISSRRASGRRTTSKISGPRDGPSRAPQSTANRRLCRDSLPGTTSPRGFAPCRVGVSCSRLRRPTQPESARMPLPRPLLQTPRPRRQQHLHLKALTPPPLVPRRSPLRPRWKAITRCRLRKQPSRSRRQSQAKMRQEMTTISRPRGCDSGPCFHLPRTQHSACPRVQAAPDAVADTDMQSTAQPMQTQDASVAAPPAAQTEDGEDVAPPVRLHQLCICRDEDTVLVTTRPESNARPSMQSTAQPMQTEDTSVAASPPAQTEDDEDFARLVSLTTTPLSILVRPLTPVAVCSRRKHRKARMPSSTHS